MLAEGQNLARTLMESPANKMTPTIFSNIAIQKLGKLPNVTVIPRRVWCGVLVGGYVSGG